MTEGPSLGTCCACTSMPAETIMMLNRRGPVGDHGWGCVVCGISGGAVAVLCEACAQAVATGHTTVGLVVKGYPKEDVRVPLDELPLGWFGHNPAAHMDDPVVE
jgi:hypothetical protein